MKLLTLITVLFVLGGCSTVPKGDWPEEIPPKSYFVEAYHADEMNSSVQTEQSYLRWIKGFYYGTPIYRRGWLKMISEVKATLPDVADQQRAETQILSAGKTIAAEWAKKEKFRKINTANVSTWGNGLIDAIDRGILFSYLDAVEADVYALIDGRLHKSEISPARYFSDHKDFGDSY